MSDLCSKIATVKDVCEGNYYRLEEYDFDWIDEMIEGLVEEEILIERVDDNGLPFNEWLSHKGAFHVPNGYELKDENGNVIHALKIVLEKANTLKTQSNNMETETHIGYTTEEQKEEIMEEKRDKAKAPNLIGEDYSGKRFGYKIPNGYEFDCIKNNEIILKPKQYQYPKTYEECCEVLGIEGGKLMFNAKDITEYEKNLIYKIGKLENIIACRDAYWKIAGDKMGLGKSWEPDNDYSSPPKYTISCYFGDIIKEKYCGQYNKLLSFPTEEMRDAFYENFKELIESVKELL